MGELKHEEDKSGVPSPGGPATEATADEAIGRPGEWQEGRYQRSGDSVKTQTPPAAGSTNTGSVRPVKGQRAVTRKDYE